MTATTSIAANIGRAVDPVALRREMAKEGVTPKAFAAQLGVSLSYMCDILSGRRRVKRNPVLIRRMADALNCRVSTICVSDERVEPLPAARAARDGSARPHQLYRLWGDGGALLYVGISTRAITRVPNHSEKPWFEEVERVTIEHLGEITRPQALAIEARVIKAENPRYNLLRPEVAA